MNQTDNPAAPFINTNQYNQPNYQPTNQPQNITYNPQPPMGYPNNQIPQNYTGPYSGIPAQPYPQNNQIIATNVPILINPNANNTLEATECFDDLNGASEATVFKYFEGLIFKDTKYEVSIKYRNGGESRKIFIGKKTSSSFFNNGKTFEIKVKYIPRDANYLAIINDKKLSFDKRFFDISSTLNVFGFSGTPNVKILNVECGNLLGNIKQPNTCCCSDPDFQIKNNLNNVKYRVCTNGCQCAYCCCDGCCCLESAIVYHILDSTHTHILGDISKNRFFNSEMLAYNIRFPLDASAEEKILLISNAIIIDNFVYRSIGSRK